MVGGPIYNLYLYQAWFKTRGSLAFFFINTKSVIEGKSSCHLKKNNIKRFHNSAYYIVGAWPRRSLVCAFENIIVWEVMFPVYLFDTWLKNWPFLFICLFVCLKTKKANNIETVITVSSIGTFPCWFGFLIFFLFCLNFTWCLMTYFSLSSLSLSRDLEFGVLTIFLGEPDSDHLLEKFFPVNHIAGRKPTEFLFGR